MTNLPCIKRTGSPVRVKVLVCFLHLDLGVLKSCRSVLFQREVTGALKSSS